MMFTRNKYLGLLFNSLKYGLLLFVIMLVMNYAALSREREVIGMHGLSYDIGLGQKVFMSCKGEGLPTVVMESAIGTNSDIYLKIQEKLSTLTKVCVYDRAGLGLSDRPFQPVVNKSAEAEKKPNVNRGIEFTVERMAEDLHHLITTSSQPNRPIMFVGTELGSLIARFYAQIYQDNVSHLVLINPLVETLLEIDNSIWNKFWYEKYVPKWYSYSLGSAIGLNRLLMMTGLLKPQVTFIDETTFNRQKHLMCNPTHMFSRIDELMNLNETLAQMKLIWSIKAFPKNISVTVLTSERDNVFGMADMSEVSKNDHRRLNEAWEKSIEFLRTNLHPNGRFVQVSDSLYGKLDSEPAYFYNLIQELVMEWRAKNLKVPEVKI